MRVSRSSNSSLNAKLNNCLRPSTELNGRPSSSFGYMGLVFGREGICENENQI